MTVGFVMDYKLAFTQEMLERSQALLTNSWRIFQFSSPIDGLDSGTLNLSINSYVKSLLTYGAHIWIFKCFRGPLQPLQKPHHGYAMYWNGKDGINTRYIRMQRAIIGAKNGTDSIGLLVRGGWLPLHYELALSGFMMFHKINSGDAGPAMYKQLNEFYESDEIWNDTIFYKACYDNIKHLESFLDPSSVPLLNQPRKRFQSLIRSAMEKQLTAFWKVHKHAQHTRDLIPTWKSFQLPPSHVSRRAEVLYYTFCFTQNETNVFRHKIRLCPDSLCRACRKGHETVSHIFLKCCKYSTQREALFSSASKFKLHPTLSNILTHPRMKTSTEVFIQHTLVHK